MAILVDTSFIIALMVTKDKNHAAAVRFASSNTQALVMPDLALVEVFFVALSLTQNYEQTATIIHRVGNSTIERILLQVKDFERINEIMHQYASAKFDLVDTAIMALSERLNITSVLTFDRRDFPIFRPKHTDYLELLPHLTGN